MKVFSLLLLLLFTVSQSGYAIEPEPLPGGMRQLESDSRELSAQRQAMHFLPAGEAEGEKSVVLAALLSAVVPGAGQIYNGDYWKAAIFLAAEGALIATAINYNQKGDDLTAEFEAYADENWSVVKYAEWIMLNREEFNLPDDCQISIDSDESKKPWERVNWDELHQCEEEVYYINPESGQDWAFSHRLPPHGRQQYYELIGKYANYNRGWADQTSLSPNWNDTLSPMFVHYATMRGDANDYYNNATTMVNLIYLNHLLSALEAVWSAINHNSDISVAAQVDPLYLPDGIEYVPRLSFGMSFSSF